MQRTRRSTPPSLLSTAAAAVAISLLAGFLVVWIPAIPGPQAGWIVAGVVAWLCTPALVTFFAVHRDRTVLRWLAVFPAAALAFAAAVAFHTAYVDPLTASGPDVFVGMFSFVFMPQAMLAIAVAAFARLRVLSRRVASPA